MSRRISKRSVHEFIGGALPHARTWCWNQRERYWNWRLQRLNRRQKKTARSTSGTRISNGWHRVAGRRISGQRTRISNWRNRRTLARGRRPRLTQAADQVRSRTPLYRGRVNPATGRPHRDDRDLGRTSDASLARTKDRRDPGPDTRRPGLPEAERRLSKALESGLEDLAAPAREEFNGAYRVAPPRELRDFLRTPGPAAQRFRAERPPR